MYSSIAVRMIVLTLLVALGGVALPGRAHAENLIPTSAKFVIGERIMVSVGPLKVRVTAGGTKIGTQATGALGKIVGGPVTTTPGFTWWKIDYVAGADGWSMEAFLKKGTPTPTPTPSPTPAPATTRINVATPSTHTVAAGGQVMITLNWDRAPMTGNYLQFMKFDNGVDPMVSLDDHTVNSATWSGSASDPRLITVPTSLPSGTYDILVGIAGYPPGSTIWTDFPLAMGEGVTNVSRITNHYKVGSITVTGGATPAPSPTPTTGGAPGPRVSNFINSGPITAYAGQVISGMRITNPNGPCITVSGVANVVIRDNEIGPCGGDGSLGYYNNANISTSNANNLLVEHNRIKDGNARAFIATGGTNITYRKNHVTGNFGGASLMGGSEFDFVTHGTIQDNYVVASLAGDSISVYESCYMRLVGNVFDVAIGWMHSVAFTMGDMRPETSTDSAGHDNYVAGNYVKQQSGGNPPGVFGSTGNTVLEHNLFANGLSAYNYAGNPNDDGSDPLNTRFQGVTVRKNAIGPGSYVRNGGVGIAEYNTNVWKNPVTPADVPAPGLGYYDGGTWVNTYIP